MSKDYTVVKGLSVLRRNNATADGCAARVKDLIKSRMDPAAFDAWIAPLIAIEESEKIILSAPSRFGADFIRATYGDIISDAASELGVSLELGFSSSSRAPRRAANINENIRANPKLSPDAFSDFICSDFNQFALSAVKKCATAVTSFSPLVIYGPSGSGKSALCSMLAKNAKMRTVFTTGNQFVSDFVRAMQTNSIFAWKDMMRNCDMLIMDDVQHLAGKRASADEFLSLLSDLIRMKKNVVLTSEISPSQIVGFDKSLVSILSSGLSVDLTPPDAAVREKILMNSGVAAASAKSIAKRCPADGHILAGICKKIAAWKELDCGELSDEVLEKLLADVLIKQNTPHAMVKNICAKLGVSFDAVMSETRARPVVLARQKIMCALKMSTDMTLAEIGRAVGGRNHASVLYALKEIEKLRQTDMLISAELSELAGAPAA